MRATGGHTGGDNLGDELGIGLEDEGGGALELARVGDGV